LTSTHFVKALAGKKFEVYLEGHVIKWNFSSAKSGEYYFNKKMSHLFFVYP
jgi:hypothetical protein